MSKIKVSIIVVKYKAEEAFLAFKKSLKAITIPYELIEIDNNVNNVGYGAGNNLGAKRAHGEYLFIVNPDTRVLPGCLEALVNFLDNNPQAGIVAPLLLNTQNQVYPLQGTSKLTPMAAIFSLSFIHKYWPNNPIAQKYWLKTWDKQTTKAVDVVPGTAFLIRKALYNQIGGFDENFFLYFEESDLCKRVSEQDWEIYITPNAQLIHEWASSTPKNNKRIQTIFNESRFYYFKKHYGFVWAKIVNWFCNPYGN
jgi:GT2 family glycosyltransferase